MRALRLQLSSFRAGLFKICCSCFAQGRQGQDSKIRTQGPGKEVWLPPPHHSLTCFSCCPVHIFILYSDRNNTNKYSQLAFVLFSFLLPCFSVSFFPFLPSFLSLSFTACILEGCPKSTESFPFPAPSTPARGCPAVCVQSVQMDTWVVSILLLLTTNAAIANLYTSHCIDVKMSSSGWGCQTCHFNTVILQSLQQYLRQPVAYCPHGLPPTPPHVLSNFGIAANQRLKLVSLCTFNKHSSFAS